LLAQQEDLKITGFEVDETIFFDNAKQYFEENEKSRRAILYQPDRCYFGTSFFEKISILR
jgi:hypothetical protein